MLEHFRVNVVKILIRLLIQVQQLVEQALNTSSGHVGDVIKLIIDIAVIE